jgi:hypothetical protein
MLKAEPAPWPGIPVVNPSKHKNKDIILFSDPGDDDEFGIFCFFLFPNYRHHEQGNFEAW